jgi:transposase-like protein
VSDFLDDRRQEITDRLKELKPVVDEFNRLEAAAAALADAIGSAASEATSVAVATVTRRRRRGRPRGSSTRQKAAKAATAAAPTAATPKVERKKPGRPKGSGKKVGRPKGGGLRATEALSLVKGQPGITIPELARKMGINENYLYRVLPGLEQGGKLEKKGRGWFLKGA